MTRCRGAACRAIPRAMTMPVDGLRSGSPLGSPPPGDFDAALATSPSVGSRSKRGPAGALETARFTPTVHEMTILRVRLFGFRFTDVLS